MIQSSEAALPAVVDRSSDEAQPIAVWENEGGLSSATAETDGPLAPTRAESAASLRLRRS